MPRSPSQSLLAKLEPDRERANAKRSAKVEIVWSSERPLHLPSLERESNNDDNGLSRLRPRMERMPSSRDTHTRLYDIHGECSRSNNNLSGAIGESPKPLDSHVGAFHIAGIDLHDSAEQNASGSTSGNNTGRALSVTISPCDTDSDIDLSIIPTAFVVPDDVSSEGKKELVGDLVVNATKAPWYSSRKGLIVLSILLTIVVVGAVVGTMLGSQEQGPQNILQLIVSESRDNGTAVSDPNSPQAAAFRWLAADPSTNSYTSTRILERYALATLYESTQGHRWTNNTNWMSYEVTECEWVMISCNELQRVEKVMMKENNLQGRLPGELFHHLSYMYELDMSENTLSGTLSKDLGGSLAWIRLQNNDLSGELSSDSFSNLHKLRSLHLYRNAFQGPLPDIWHLEDLQVLRLSENLLSGSLSPGIGALLNLEALWLHNNSLTGSIPSELGSLHRLDYLILRFNHFSGSIPSELGELTKMGKLGLKHKECIYLKG